jgi:DNA-binding XRE family transcriptional regulator
MSKTYGPSIRIYRDQREVSQDALSEKLGLMHRSTLIDIEKGRVEVSRGFAERAKAAIDRLASTGAAES